MRRISQYNQIAATYCTILSASIGLPGTGCDSSEGDSAPLGEMDSFMPETEAPGGVQNFGHYKEILQQGGIPGPTSIHSSDLFDAHELPLPLPDCMQSICLHGSFAVHPSFVSNAYQTIVLLVLQPFLESPVYDESRIPLHLSIAIDASNSMAGERLEYIQAGLRLMLAGLTNQDRVSITTFSDTANVLTEYQLPDSTDLATAIDQIQIGGSSNLFDGLYQSYELAHSYFAETHQNRVLLISDGEANRGITNSATISKMSHTYNRRGISLSTIGIGTEFNADLLRALARSGAGSYYSLQNLNAVPEVFVQEAQTSMVPVAKNAKISVKVFESHEVNNVYGIQRATITENQVEIDLPLLQATTKPHLSSKALAHRQSGGAILVELSPSGSSSVETQVAQLDLIHEDISSGISHSQSLLLESPISVIHPPNDGIFSHPTAIEAFAMFNFYQAMYQASEHAMLGWGPKAIDTLDQLTQAALWWLNKYPDPEVEIDHNFAKLFIENLLSHGASTSLRFQ